MLIMLLLPRHNMPCPLCSKTHSSPADYALPLEDGNKTSCTLQLTSPLFLFAASRCSEHSCRRTDGRTWDGSYNETSTQPAGRGEKHRPTTFLLYLASCRRMWMDHYRSKRTSAPKLTAADTKRPLFICTALTRQLGRTGRCSDGRDRSCFFFQRNWNK